MCDVEVKKMMDVANSLRRDGKYKEASDLYYGALERTIGTKNELWQKKVICMACTGLGFVYAKVGMVDAAMENLAEAVMYAPTDEARDIAERNLEKYQKAIKDKTGTEVIFHFIEK